MPTGWCFDNDNLYVKTDFSYEIYRDKVTSPALRRLITQMHTSRHILRIKTGRYGQQRLERFERRCQVCDSGDIEDEFHFDMLILIITITDDLVL